MNQWWTCPLMPGRLLLMLFLKFQEKVRNQDTVFVVAGVTGSIQGRELGWKFVQENWMTFHDRYQGGFLLPRLMKCMTENFVSEEKAMEVETFFSTKPVPASERVLQQSLENIRLNAEWMRRESAAIVKYLKDRPAS